MTLKDTAASQFQFPIIGGNNTSGVEMWAGNDTRFMLLDRRKIIGFWKDSTFVEGSGQALTICGLQFGVRNGSGVSAAWVTYGTEKQNRRAYMFGMKR
jgi:hypothetical protein